MGAGAGKLKQAQKEEAEAKAALEAEREKLAELDRRKREVAAERAARDIAQKELDKLKGTVAKVEQNAESLAQQKLDHEALIEKLTRHMVEMKERGVQLEVELPQLIEVNDELEQLTLKHERRAASAVAMLERLQDAAESIERELGRAPKAGDPT